MPRSSVSTSNGNVVVNQGQAMAARRGAPPTTNIPPEIRAAAIRGMVQQLGMAAPRVAPPSPQQAQLLAAASGLPLARQVAAQPSSTTGSIQTPPASSPASPLLARALQAGLGNTPAQRQIVDEAAAVGTQEQRQTLVTEFGQANTQANAAQVQSGTQLVINGAMQATPQDRLQVITNGSAANPAAAGLIVYTAGLAVPDQVISFAQAAAGAAPQQSPQIAQGAAQAVPQQAMQIAIGVSQVAPQLAPQIAQRVAQVAPQFAKQIAAAVSMAVPQMQAQVEAGADAGAGQPPPPPPEKPNQASPS